MLFSEYLGDAVQTATANFIPGVAVHASAELQGPAFIRNYSSSSCTYSQWHQQRGLNMSNDMTILNLNKHSSPSTSTELRSGKLFCTFTKTKKDSKTKSVTTPAGATTIPRMLIKQIVVLANIYVGAAVCLCSLLSYKQTFEEANGTTSKHLKKQTVR